MKHGGFLVVICCALISITACSGVHLRKDVFLSQPVWEAGTNNRLEPAGKVLPPQFATQEEALGSVPALFALLKQSGLVDEAKIALVAASATAVVQGTASSTTLEADSLLPTALAKNGAVKAMLMSAQESVLHARVKGYSNQLSESRISLGEFKEFIRALNATVLQPYRNSGMSATRVNGNPTYQWLLQKYFGAYFTGKFIDRTGAVTTKAKLSNTITDADITGVEHVFLESVWDWIIIASNLKVPILYSVSGATKTFLIANPSNVPTLVTALESLNLALPIPGIVEQVSSDDHGLSKVKLCLIKSASGAAGAAAEGTSGIIVRALGGANLGWSTGLGVLGKISIGDNNLLTQMVDTWTESTGQRSTEIFASEILYGVPLPNATSEFCDT
jgi:hypothetical protein